MAEAFTSNIRHPTPNVFDWKDPTACDIFEPLSKKSNAFLLSHNVQLERLMSAAEQSPTPVGIANGEVDIKFSHKLHALPTLLCAHDALKLVWRDDDIDENGEKIVSKIWHSKNLQHFGYMQEILDLKFREATLERHLIDYKLENPSYENRDGRQTKAGIKTRTLLNGVPKNLQHYLWLNLKLDAAYDELHTFLTSQAKGTNYYSRSTSDAIILEQYGNI